MTPQEQYEHAKEECWAWVCENHQALGETTKKAFEYAFRCAYRIGQKQILSNLSTTGKNWKDGERLQVATSILQGLLSSGQEKHPVKRALELADALITECNK